MLLNYLRLAWRNLRRQKLYSGINIGGLTVGLAVGILLLLWVQDELSYDRFHEQASQIYRLSVTMKSGTTTQTWGGVPGPIAPQSLAKVPGVQAAVRTVQNYDISKVSNGTKDFFDLNSMYADPSFFNVFTFPLLAGNPQQPFTADNSVVLTRKTAMRLFGTTAAIGKIFQVNDNEPYVVSAVMKDMPANSEIQADMLFPFSILARRFQKGFWPSLDEDWGDFFYTTYVQLQGHPDLPGIAKKMTLLRPDMKDDGSMKYNLQPLSEMHLYNLDGSEGSIKVVRIFLIIAIVILLIACVNYVNLSTARAVQRAMEIGVRKIVGGTRLQLFVQFLSESVLVFAIALLLALIAIFLIIPFYNQLTDKHLLLGLNNLQLILAIAAAMLLTLIVAGIYPAVLLSSFHPLKTLKGRLVLKGSNISFRKALVVVQFVIATVLIVNTLIVGQQLHFIRSRALGYDKENVFMFPVGAISAHLSSAEEELAATPGVRGVTLLDQEFAGLSGGSTGDTEWDGKGKDESLIIHATGADKNLVKVMHLQLLAGSDFRGTPADSAHYIINETAAKMMGMKSPVGKRFKLWNKEGLIIGVVKDFHFASLHEKIEPVVFHYQPQGWAMYVRTTGKDAPGAIAAAEKLYTRYNPGYPFKYSFLDASIDKMYKSDQRTGLLFNYFAGIAIFISCLGLFGLATFSTSQRIKEIGVRKVLGASVMNIITLLSSDFLKIVALAIFVATPIAWYMMNRWLDDYAYRISIRWWVFLLAGMIAVLIALFTVSFQAVKAALMNPARSLKTE